MKTGLHKLQYSRQEQAKARWRNDKRAGQFVFMKRFLVGGVDSREEKYINARLGNYCFPLFMTLFRFHNFDETWGFSGVSFVIYQPLHQVT
jgi:hypothetical protein